MISVERSSAESGTDRIAHGVQATLAEVDILSELDLRATRSPNYEREQRAVADLATEMAVNPRNTLQKLVEIAVDLCDAETAGVSLLEGDVFRWEAVAGVFATARGGTMPRDASPCGVCIDRNAPQLMHLADRLFPALLTTPRFVEALLIPFHDRGKPIGTVWIVSHNDDRKFDREDERIVRVLAKFASVGWHLWQASEHAAAVSRRQNDFLATLSHELRNPLSVIMAASSVLQQRTAEPSVSRAVGAIGRQAQHMNRLIGDLLDIARIASGKLQLERKNVDLRTIVAETIDTRRAQIERRRQVLTVELGAAPACVDADPVRLAQVLSNLIDNAAKYTPDDGHITVTLSSTGNQVLVEVRDTGVGIPAERLQSIFEPLTQLPSSENSAGGLGLGLTLVRSLMELHGGGVDVASAGPGGGSRFTIWLPLQREVDSAAGV